MVLSGASEIACANADPGTSEVPAISLTEAETAWLRSHPVIKLGIDRDFAPYEWIDRDGNYVGIAADYFALLEKKLGIRFEIVKDKSWAEIINMAKTGQVDMLACAVKTSEREKYLTFTRPYQVSPIIIVSDSRSGYLSSISRLAGKKVVVEKGYFMHELLEREHPEISVVTAENVQKALQMVANRGADAYVGDAVSATFAIKQTGLLDLRFAGETNYQSAHAVAVIRAHPELAGLIAKALDTVTPEERDRVANRWMSLKAPEGISVETVVKYAVSAGSLILVFTFWNFRLRREVRARISAENNARLHAQALEESQSFNMSVFNSMVEHVAVLDRDGAIIFVNKAWRDFAIANGAPRLSDNSVGLSYFTVCDGARNFPDGEEADKAQSGIRAVMNGQMEQFALEYRCDSPGERRWFRLHVVPLLGSAGGVVTLHENITLQKDREQQRIQEEERYRNTLIREVHHRINNNLQGVAGLLNIQINNHPEAAGSIRDVIAKIKSLGVVYGIQGKQIDAGVSLTDMAREICEVTGGLTEKPVSPGFEADCDGRIEVAKDKAVPVALIVNELVTNAIKHGDFPDTSEQIMVKISRDAEAAVVAVSNPAREFSAAIDFEAGKNLGTGLSLIRTMMPSSGAKLVLTWQSGVVTAQLRLTEPVVLFVDRG